MSLLFLYPGQGSQRPGMLHGLPRSPAVDRTLGEAADVLGDLAGLDTLKELQTTTSAQLALLIVGVAAARALTEEQGLEPAFVAGHSVGAFAAAVTAGVLSFHAALAAVRLRGELMERTARGRVWGMAALLGLPLPTARALTEQVGTDDDPLWIANINAADQIVLSGTDTALRRAEPAAQAAGARSLRRLDVAVASHCPLQQHTAERLADHFAPLPRTLQHTPYLTNVRGRCVRDNPDAVLDDLAQAVAHPVHWYDATRLAAELGATCAVQMPPGHVLTDLLATAAPAIGAVSTDDHDFRRAAAHIRRTLRRTP